MLVPSPHSSPSHTWNQEGDRARGNESYPQNRYITKRRLLQGWRFGVMCCAIATFIVFLINLAGTLWGLTHQASERGVIFEGDCQEVHRTNTVSHLLINLLGTVLLSSSSYSMQCLSAPTRREVNQAHLKGVWLDIGVPSFRNLRHIRKFRVVLWALLALSSLPLHLL
jgi:hypothetical protein